MTAPIGDSGYPKTAGPARRTPRPTSPGRERTPRRRGLTGMLVAALIAPLVTVVLSVATAGPAYADCAVIPPDRDINVTRQVYEVGQRLAVNPKVMLAGFETGIVESHMNNLNCGDRDSLGVFQQRPSQGWGTPQQVMDVYFAANTFFTRAIANDRNNPGMSAGNLAQSVQISCCPWRYDEVEA